MLVAYCLIDVVLAYNHLLSRLLVLMLLSGVRRVTTIVRGRWLRSTVGDGDEVIASQPCPR